MKMKTQLIVLLLLGLSSCFAQELVSSSPVYEIKHLDNCNTKYANFGTTFYGDNQVIYSSPKKKSWSIKNLWLQNNQPFLELYLADIGEDNELVHKVKINSEVNSRYHESNVAFTNDLHTVYFSRDKYYEGHLDKDGNGMTHIAIYKADVVSPQVWNNIVEMPFNNRNYCVGHPTLSEDNKTLYFSSKKNGTADIFKVSINEDGTYGEPIRLNERINTSGSERFPFIGENNTLYFSSDKPGGFGKLDVYAIRLDGKSEAVNLGSTLNSDEDDFSFVKKKGLDYGYFSSNRTSGKGDDDIYYFKELIPLPCKQIVEGIVVDKDTGKKLPNALVVLSNSLGKKLDEMMVNTDAKFSFKIDCMNNFVVQASKENYSFDSKKIISDSNIEVLLVKDKVEVVSTQLGSLPPAKLLVTESLPPTSISVYDACQEALDNINNIYFDLDKFSIRSDAAIELNKVVSIMERCPNINIEASSHTDCRASHEYNQKLSQRRAQSTVDYILQRGISPTRIYAVGYGENRLKNRCVDGVICSEEEHQINRRTQFEITNY